MTLTVNQNAALEIAIKIANGGLPCFPCQDSKAPTCPGGWKRATKNIDELRDLWNRYPGTLVGVPTGVITGFHALDIDPRHGGDTWYANNAQNLVPTWTQRTRSGGLHLLFKQRDGIGLSAGKIAPGVDVRGDGGYIIAWWAHDYPIIDGSPIAAWPEWLAEKIISPLPNLNAIRPTKYGNSYVQGALNNAIQTMAGAVEGSRNQTLNNQALALGRFVSTGDLNIHQIIATLLPPALSAGLDHREIIKTIASALCASGCNVDNIETIANDAINNLHNAQEDWPPLISLDMPNLPSLSGDELPSWAGSFVKALAKSTETPPELATAMVLAACGTAISRRFKLSVREGYSEPLNVWMAAALPPGNRKSAVQTLASAPLLSWESKRAKEMEPHIKQNDSDIKTLQAQAAEYRKKATRAKDMDAEMLFKKVAQIEASIPERLRPPQLWTSDATPERLGTLLAENGERLAWLSSEGGIFDTLSGRYSGGIPNLDLMLKTHSGDAERVDRGSRPPVFLKYPLLTIGLSPQPGVLKGLASKPGLRSRGLLARFLYLVPASALGYRSLELHALPQNIEAKYHAGIYAILDKSPLKNADGDEILYTLSLSPEAYEEWLSFAKEMEVTMRPNAQFEHATDWAAKATGATARLAGVMHVILHATSMPELTLLSLDTMKRAIILMKVISQHSLHALDLMGSDMTTAAARKVWNWIESGRRNKFTIRDVHQALRGSFSRVKDVKEALSVLDERGYIEITNTLSTGGRKPSSIVTVRPDITDKWRQ